MSIANYGQLKTFLATFGIRTDLTAIIPDFVKSAESMIAQRVRALEMVTTAQLTDAQRVSGGVYTLPSNWLGARNVFSADGEVKPAALYELRRYVVSAPVFQYATYGLTMEFRGAPAVGATIDLIYFARPATFTNDSDTNTLLTNHQNLYIHAGLHWLHLHTQDLELANQHLQLFDQTAEGINSLEVAQRGSGSAAQSHNLTSRSTM